MSYDDLFYFRGDYGHRLVVAIQDDADRWVDFNAVAPAGVPDYCRGLLRPRPSISVQIEPEPGIYVAVPSSIRMDNLPWNGNDYGFWDAPLPVVINRSGTTYQFTSWNRRKMKLSVEFFNQNGTYLRTDDVCVFMIEKVATNGGNEAELVLNTIIKPIMTASAETVKHGSEWYKGMPIGALVYRLAKAAIPSLSIDPTMATTVLDLGTLDTPMASSWGQQPGILANGEPAIYHWIPRHLGTDRINATKILIGHEVPGAQDTSGGGITSFDVTTGRTTIVARPEDAHAGAYYLKDSRVIFTWANTATHVIAAIVKENPLTAFPSGFYKLRIVQFHRTDGTATLLAGPFNYWPARWALRKGVPFDANIREFGRYSGNAVNFMGENIAVPFPQTIDTLWDYLSGQSTAGSQEQWNTYVGSGYETDASYLVNLPARQTTVGQGAGFVSASGANNSAAIRHWMTDTWHGPCLMGDGSVNGSKHLYWISDNAYSWKIRRVRIDASPYTAEEWDLTNMADGDTPAGTDHLYTRQITAYGFNGNVTTSTRKMLIATMEWDETASATAPRSRACLWLATFNTASGTEATLSLLTSIKPSVGSPNITSGVFVGIHPLPANTDDFYHQTYRYVPMVILNRGDLTGRPYRVGIWDAQAAAWAISYEASAIAVPSSSKPFAGFTLNHTDGRIYFTDEASGQLWSVNPTGTGDYRLENGAVPIHSKEPHLATNNGRFLTTGGYDYMFWAMAPGPHGDVTTPYWQRAAAKPSSARYVAGLYPLIQFSRKVADSIDVADFSGLKCGKAIGMLMQIAYNYALRVTPAGMLQLVKRIAGTPVGDLRFTKTRGIVNVEDGQIPLYNYRKELLIDQVINVVDVTPHQLKLNPADDPVPLAGAGSKFAGNWMWDTSGTDRPMRIRIVCVSGGDLLQGVTAATKHAILWRYERVLETIHTYLVLGVASTDTVIRVAGFNVRGDRFYCGEQEIRAGDSVQVMGSTLRSISALAIEGETAVAITLSGAVDVSAEALSEVLFVPREGQTVSDSDEGITTLAVQLNIGSTTATLTSAAGLRVGMVIQIHSELMEITGIAGNVVTIVREKWQTSQVTHALDSGGTKVRAYIATQEPNRLYDVGDTGIRFGVEIDTESITDPGQRSVVANDGIIITTHGYSLAPMEHAVAKAIDAASIAANDNQRFDLSISDNRFLDQVKAKVLGAAVLAARSEPRIGLPDGEIPYWPGLTGGSTATCSEGRIIPNELSTNFEAQAIYYDLERFWMRVNFRAFDAVAGAGKKGSASSQQGYAHIGRER